MDRTHQETLRRWTAAPGDTELAHELLRSSRRAGVAPPDALDPRQAFASLGALVHEAVAAAGADFLSSYAAGRVFEASMPPVDPQRVREEIRRLVLPADAEWVADGAWIPFDCLEVRGAAPVEEMFLDRATAPEYARVRARLAELRELYQPLVFEVQAEFPCTAAEEVLGSTCTLFCLPSLSLCYLLVNQTAWM